MATTIKMPQLGESVTEGTIERWLVKEGDTVEQYDPLFEVVTDKVNAEVPAEVAGKITKIMVSDGETVKVGTPLAEIETDGAAAAEAPAVDDAAAAEAPAADAAEAPAADAADDAAAEAPAAEPPGAEAEPAVAQETPPASAPAAEPEPEPTTPADDQAASLPGTTEAAPPATTDGNVRMTPAVRRLVREHDVDIAQLHGSGAGGRVTRDDVLAFIEKGGERAAAAAQEQPTAAVATPAAPAVASAPAPVAEAPAPPAAPAYRPPAQMAAPSGGDVEVPMSQMRKGIARKMTQVKQTVPHAYTVVEVDMTNVVRWREANNEAFKAREGASLSYVAVVVKAVTETLRQHPTLNSQFADEKIILKHELNIGIAVAVENGLIVPVIRNADQLSISGVNQRIRDLSARANTNKLRLDEVQGGTFTVNNTGWFGSVSSMPIINAPEVAILSMEAIVKRPAVIEVDGSDVIAVREIMNMTCSFDHRVLDGAQVGAFLADVRKRLEGWGRETPIG
jgi:2-oxoisovalerate dehydrogenase E2 component (dihydrolipoyl transacylase)